jgi:hypothetical protein
LKQGITNNYVTGETKGNSNNITVNLYQTLLKQLCIKSSNKLILKGEASKLTTM